MRAKFSVLMSVYDKERPEYLSKSLDSVFLQTLKPDEVVLIEDGTLNEELEKTVKQYERKYKNLKVVRFKENRGLGLALRDGVCECCNEIIFRMDTDDIACHDRFEKQLKVFSEKDPDVVGSNIAEYDDEMKEITGQRIVPERHEEILNRMKTKNPINHMTVAYKKSSVLKAGNYQSMQGFEDYYLWARMAKNGSTFYNVQENLVKVRGGASLMSRRGGKKYLKAIYSFEKSLRKIGLIGPFLCYGNTILRAVVCVSPKNLRSLFYKKALRSRA